MIFVAESRQGGEIRYRDQKRYLWFISVFHPVIPGICAFIVAQTGQYWLALFPIVFYYGILPILDANIGEDPHNPPEEIVEQMAEDQYYRRLLLLSVPSFFFSFVATLYVVAAYDMPLWASMFLVIGTAIVSGSGLTVAHELGHKSNRVDQWGAKIMCALTGYGHFCIEHNRGHHIQVATPEDPASARLGESIYAFAARELPTVLASGLKMEAKRLERKGLPFLHWRNDILQSYALTLVIAALLIAVLGWMILPFIVLHHFIGWYQLTQANYVEHYGLKRKMLDNGRREPCQPKHSWNTNHILSNLVLFHLQRHSDHHTNPIRPYQSLRNFDDIPRLPSGYPGCFVLAAIPPLWRRIMDKKVWAWAKGNVDDANVQPGLEDRYAKQFAAWSNS